MHPLLLKSESASDFIIIFIKLLSLSVLNITFIINNSVTLCYTHGLTHCLYYCFRRFSFNLQVVQYHVRDFRGYGTREHRAIQYNCM